ncbi:MAG: FUSC family protein [Acidobacteriaceae bacterium]
MATFTLTAPRSSTLEWLRDFLRDELAPYPGRTALVARMVLTATLVILVTMVFKIPYGAYAALFALTISRENPDATIKAVTTLIVSFAAAVAYVLVGALIFSSEPVIRLVWVLVTLFLMFFALNAISNYTAALRFGYLLAIAMPLFDSRISGEAKVEGLLWAAGAIALASIITAVVEVIYASLYKLDEVTAALLERLRWTEAALRAWAAGDADRAAQIQLTRLAVLGTSRMRRDLLRSGYPAEVMQQTGTVVSLVGRLIDLAANMNLFSGQVSGDARRRFGELAGRIDGLAHRLGGGGASEQPEKSPATGGILPEAAPLLMDMERTVSSISDVLSGSAPAHGPRLRAEVPMPRTRFFVADAFTNPNHIRFAIRGSLAAAVCYLIYNLTDWPGISTAVTTCFLTATTTIGASRQKQILRFGGAFVGGIVAIGAQIFVLPGLDTIAGLTLLFVAATFLAAWIATSGPRLSYSGVQFAFVFYLVTVGDFRFEPSLAVARDRVVGILLGLLVMWLIFDQLWGAPAIQEMKRTFLSTLRLVAQFMREPVSSGPFDQLAAIERSYAQRETINTNINKLRETADGVMLEFGPSREADLAVRSRLLQWQVQLRVIFITRIALLKYRLRLPGFELPERILQAEQEFDAGLAGRIEAIADHLQGKTSLAAQRREPLLGLIAEPIQEYRRTEPAPEIAARLGSLLPLCSRIDALVASLTDDVAAGS